MKMRYSKCESGGHVELIPHSCKSRFCPTCGKHATDVWANQVLNGLLDVAYHHLIQIQRLSVFNPLFHFSNIPSFHVAA
ncbi:MAG: transposase zinc-binding domain-containing protein [Deltaproteobacteria bacterium]|nr:transposase zinc-binding domain-containing protein [Deltaproteobacteria bacterium]MBW1945217.1 transposase zinc-binding domain-containing protein [Deltaproteobacteria bacterium]MBW2209194.1 transposase zinc-binding domain-containing protein [Deltaproteobacteria bacterium]